MIDIALAASGAIKAYELLKKGVATGKEIDSMSGTVRAFFKAKHQVERGVEEQEKNKDPLSGSSLEQAVRNVEELEAIKRAEERIKWMYINAGKSALWGKIRAESLRLDMMKAKAKEQSNSDRAAEDALLRDIMYVFGGLFAVIIAVGLAVFLFMVE